MGWVESGGRGGDVVSTGFVELEAEVAWISGVGAVLVADADTGVKLYLPSFSKRIPEV